MFIMYEPTFTISNAILKNIGTIEACREVIDHAPLLPYYEKKFQDEAMVRRVHYGTHIEGNELNLTQAGQVLSGEDVTARPRDVQEVINYRKVMDYIEAKSEKLKVQNSEQYIDEEVIKTMHALTVERLLDEGKGGVFRTTQVVVRNSLTREVSYRPPEASVVGQQMAELLTFLNTNIDIHPVLKSGIVHYEFVRIHPFVDGNGRVARALSTLLLLREGYDIRNFFSLEEHFDKHPEDYYQALQSVLKNEGNITEWLTYFSECLAIELSNIKQKIEKISVDGKLRQKLGGKPLLLTDRQLRIMEYIQEVGFLQNQAFKTLFPMVSEDTMLNELKGLVAAGIIKKTGITKGARYMMV